MSDNSLASTSGLKRKHSDEDIYESSKRTKAEAKPLTHCAATPTTDSVITTTPRRGTTVIVSPAQRHATILAIVKAMYENFKLE